MNCPNCNQERLGTYCGHCGQNDRDYQRTLPPVLSDLLRETFEIDSRLLRTVKQLLFKPGELALEFSRNRRASYVSPIRLYLFVSLLFFFLLSLTADFEADTESEVVALELELEEVADTDISGMLQIFGEGRRAKIVDIVDGPDTSVAKLILLLLADEISKRPEAMDSVDIFLAGQIIDALHRPGTALNQLLDNLPIAIFVMLPVYALLLKLFYFRKRRYYVETLVFATHMHTFAFLVFTVLLALPEQSDYPAVTAIVSVISTGLTLSLGIYHYLALKRYFQEGRWTTLVKFSGLMIFYLLLLSPAALAMVVVFTLATV